MPLKGLTPGMAISGFPSPIPIKGATGNIKTNQQGTSTMAATAQQKIAISSVDITKSVIIINNNSDINVSTSMIRAQFNSAIEIQFDTFASSSVGFSWQVLEFQGVKSVQTGTLSYAGSTNSASISAVVPSKTEVFFSFLAGGASTALIEATSFAYVSASTIVTFAANNSATITKTCRWFVVEYF